MIRTIYVSVIIALIAVGLIIGQPFIAGASPSTNASEGLYKAPTSQASASTKTPSCTAVTGNVFLDPDGDGIQEPGEAGQSGVVVRAKNPATGVVIAKTTTDASGNYSFPKLGSGKKTVLVVLPTGYIGTTPSTVTVTLPPCQSVNFGLRVKPKATPTAAPTLNPADPQVPQPSEMVSDSSHSHLFVASQTTNSLYVVDEVSLSTVAIIPVGVQPFDVGLFNDKVYVSNQGDMLSPASLSVIDAVGLTKIKDIPLASCGSQALHIGINPLTSSVYVALYSPGSVAVIDALSDTLTGCVATNAGAFGVAVHPTSNSIFVGNRDGHDLWRIDGVTNTAARVVNWVNSAGSGTPYYVGIDLTHNRLLAMLASQPSNPVNKLYVYSIGSHGGLGTAKVVTVGNTMDGGQVLSSSCSNLVFIAETAQNDVRVLNGNLSLKTVLKGANGIGSQPFGLAQDASVGHIYVSNRLSNAVSLVDECKSLWTPTPLVTPTSTNTPTPSNTPGDTPTNTITATDYPTWTPASTAPLATNTPTGTPTLTATQTPTVTPTSTDTPTETDIPTNTPTDSPTATRMPTVTPTTTPTNTATKTATSTPTNTPTNTATYTPTKTHNIHHQHANEQPDGDAHANNNADHYSHQYCNEDVNKHSDLHTDLHKHTDQYPYQHLYADEDQYSHQHANEQPDGDAHADHYADRCSHQHCNEDSNEHANEHSDQYSDLYEHADKHSH